MQNASGTIATQVDAYNGDYFNSNSSFKFKRPFIPSDWLLLSAENGNGLYGDLYNGESNQITIEVNALDLIEDTYLASIIISSNSVDDIEIPIVLNVISEGGVLGDLNEDTVVNIQDIVLLVNVILASGEFLENGDLNQDGLLDAVSYTHLTLPTKA